MNVFQLLNFAIPALYLVSIHETEGRVRPQSHDNLDEEATPPRPTLTPVDIDMCGPCGGGTPVLGDFFSRNITGVVNPTESFADIAYRFSVLEVKLRNLTSTFSQDQQYYNDGSAFEHQLTPDLRRQITSTNDDSVHYLAALYERLTMVFLRLSLAKNSSSTNVREEFHRVRHYMEHQVMCPMFNMIVTFRMRVPSCSCKKQIQLSIHSPRTHLGNILMFSLGESCRDMVKLSGCLNTLRLEEFTNSDQAVLWTSQNRCPLLDPENLV